MTRKEPSLGHILFRGIMAIIAVIVIFSAPFGSYHLVMSYAQEISWLSHIFAIFLSWIGAVVAFFIALAIFGRFLPDDIFDRPSTR